MIRAFSWDAEPMILLTTPVLTGVGLNLQLQCHLAIFIDPAMSKGLWRQGACRLHRINQKHSVEIFF